MSTPKVNEALQRARLDYVQRCFQNAHELNTLMDQKANFLLAAVALVTGALGIIASASLDRKVPGDWQMYLKIGSFVLLLVYLVIAFRVILIVTQVYRARGQMFQANSHAPGLLFPLLVMSRYPTEELYKSKVYSISYDDIIEDYSNQIVEVSNIYKFKQEKINAAADTFQILVWLWVATVLLMALTAFLLPA